MNTGWQLKAAHSGTFLQLKKLLQRVKGFRLFLLQYNQVTYRDGVIRALNEGLSGQTLRVLDVSALGSYNALEQALLQDADEQLLTHIINLDRLNTEEQALVQPAGRTPCLRQGIKG